MPESSEEVATWVVVPRGCSAYFGRIAIDPTTRSPVLFDVLQLRFDTDVNAADYVVELAYQGPIGISKSRGGGCFGPIQTMWLMSIDGMCQCTPASIEAWMVDMNAAKSRPPESPPLHGNAQ
jgi:hypothetical protein